MIIPRNDALASKRAPSIEAESVEPCTSCVTAQKLPAEPDPLFQLVFDQSPIGMALVGLDGRFLRVNRSLCEIVGYAADELTARTFQEITHPDDLATDLALAEKLARGELASYAIAKRYLRKDGTPVDVMLHGSAIRGSRDEALYYLAQIEDRTDEKRAEDALRRAAEQFRDLVDQAPDGIFIADLDGRYTDVNHAACELLGYSREELLGKTVGELIPAEHLSRLVAVRERLLEPGQVEHGEWALRQKNGALIPVEVSAKILADGRWQAFVRDIRSRKLTEEVLRRSEEALNRAQHVAHLGSWEWDLRTNELTRSEELYAIYGLSGASEAAPPLALGEYTHLDDRQRVEDSIRKAIRAAEPCALEYRIRRPNGEERDLLMQGEVIVANGVADRFVGTVLDVTERRAAEREREALSRWFHAVFEQAPIGILLFHADKSEVDLNACAKAMFGRSSLRAEDRAQVLARADGSALAIEELPSARALRGQIVDGEELVVRRAGERPLPVLVSAAPIVGADESVVGAVAAVQNISATKELERLRGEWSAVVAHDLKQPLGAIAIHVQALARSLTDERARRPLLQIQSSVRSLARMVDDLMDLSRIDARRVELMRAPCDLRALVGDSVERAILTTPGALFDVRAPAEPLSIDADAGRLAQVVDNLLSNAIKYGAVGAPIAVSIVRRAAAVEVAVTNSGPEIPAAQRGRLFQRFQRAENAKVAGIRGTGLGLYIVRELVEAHGEASRSRAAGGARPSGSRSPRERDARLDRARVKFVENAAPVHPVVTGRRT